MDEILATSRMVRKESGLSLWNTPQGDYWIPDGDAHILPVLLAQEERSI